MTGRPSAATTGTVLSPATPPGAVVVGLDPLGSSDDALEWAAREAARHELPLHLVHAPSWPDAGPVDQPEPEDATVLSALARVRDAHPDLAVTGRTETGSAAALLVESSQHASLVVLGSHQQGPWSSSLWASLTQLVPLHARAPVAVVPPGSVPSGAAATTERTVVVGVDGSLGARAALLYAVERAHRDGEGLIAVLCRPHPGHPGTEDTVGRLCAELDRLRVERPGLDAVLRVVDGSPTEVLLDHSVPSTVLVVGSRGRSGVTGLLLGSVAGRLLGRTRGPAIVVRSESVTIQEPVPGRRDAPEPT